MRRRRMGALHVGEPRVSFQQQQVARNGRGAVVEEIHGLIRVYKDGHVERLPAIPDVPCTWGGTAPGAQGGVVARDVVINRATGVWARLYAPTTASVGAGGRLPVVVYFHGGGFCVCSAAWSCYHEFLAQLAARAGCAVMSVDYRLAPEHRLPAAFDDGLAAVRWLRHQAAASRAASDDLSWWWTRCSFDRVFLMGDSAGANIAFHVAARLGQGQLGALSPLAVKGAILVQPFFGGEARTASEKTMPQPPRSALSLPTSDCYWRLALPAGASRDHPWCNPLSRAAPRLETLPLPSLLVCVSETDILRDRNLELCSAMRKAGKSVEQAMYGGVGHAFQVLHNCHLSQQRTQEMLAHIKAFLSAR
ncbi:probable carboxylesterase 17 [Phragmites australis]|uniref:probable carboxylesterase 17 n=1 Tax=Phragmites australis TaxID=29695 RepID=UPI002D78B31C|nr:probable carboxylesterase 17 [Phragmites australis]